MFNIPPLVVLLSAFYCTLLMGIFYSLPLLLGQSNVFNGYILYLQAELCSFCILQWRSLFTILVTSSICSLVMKPGKQKPESHLRVCWTPNAVKSSCARSPEIPRKKENLLIRAAWLYLDYTFPFSSPIHMFLFACWSLSHISGWEMGLWIINKESRCAPFINQEWIDGRLSGSIEEEMSDRLLAFSWKQRSIVLWRSMNGGSQMGRDGYPSSFMFTRCWV